MRGLRRTLSTLAVIALAVGIAAAASGGAGKHPRSRPHPRPDPLASLRLYVDPNNPAAVQAATWRASGDDADAVTIERIAAEPTPRWFADSSDPEAAAAAVVDAAAARGAVAELVLYNIPRRDCSGYSIGGAASGREYLAWARRVAQGIAQHPVIVVLEPDAIPQAADGCLPPDQAAARYRLLAQAVAILKSNRRAHVYVDAGNAAWLPVGRIVGPLRRSGVAQADGFALNVANFQTTRATIAYGRRIAGRLGARHFVIDTSRNGNGPPRATGVRRWCNPSGRALGSAPTTHTGDPLVDALLWIKPPGASDGACGQGEPPAGTWWPAYALQLARVASGR